MQRTVPVEKRPQKLLQSILQHHFQVFIEQTLWAPLDHFEITNPSLLTFWFIIGFRTAPHSHSHRIIIFEYSRLNQLKHRVHRLLSHHYDAQLDTQFSDASAIAALLHGGIHNQ